MQMERARLVQSEERSGRTENRSCAKGRDSAVSSAVL